MQFIIRFWLLGFGLLLLSACGDFHLRGQDYFPPRVKQIYIKMDEKQLSFRAALVQAFHQQQIDVTFIEKNPILNLEINDLLFTESVISYSKNEPDRIIFKIEIYYALLIPDVKILKRGQVTHSKNIETSSQQPSIQSSKRQWVEQELLQAASYQLVYQISRFLSQQYANEFL